MTATGAERASPSVLAVANAHIDPVWIWGWQEGMREVQATFQAAVDRLEEFSDLVFTASSASHYAWVEQMDAPLFEKIRALVSAGRWVIVGGEWVEPDCNIPSGESVCRQLLYGQRYFHRAFGRTATIGYNIDSFGHAGSLPQLLLKSGLEAYVMMRPQEHERHIPSALFLWVGTDGSTVLTYRIPFSYNSGPTGGQSGADEERELVHHRAEELSALSASEHMPFMLFFGIGDHGGGPTRAAIDEVRLLRDEAGLGVTFGDPERYFGTFSDRRGAGIGIPEVEGDLHMHAVGCYSVVSSIKADNARAESALVAAEKLAALSSLLSGEVLDVGRALETAWRHVLFNQFHDSLGGTCTPEAFSHLAQFHGYALALADEVTTRATQLMAAQVNTWVDGAERVERFRSAYPYVAHFPVPVVVFNPLSWAVRVPLTLPHDSSVVSDERGEVVPVQKVGSGEATRYPHHSLVVADLPAFGYRVYFLHDPGPSNELGGGAVSDGAERGVNDWSLSNGAVTVVVDKARGGITALSGAGRERWLGPEPIRPVVLDDPSDTWSHGVVSYDADEHECELLGIRRVEEGPLRTTVRLAYSWGRSRLYEDVSVYADLGYVDLRVRLDWHERHKLVKLVVPVALDKPAGAVGLPYGTISRPTNGHEEVFQHWVDVYDAGGYDAGGGLACLSDIAYGYDLAGGRLRVTLVRSPRYADHNSPWSSEDELDSPATDQGWHTFRLRLLPHSGSWAEAGVPRAAVELCTAFPAVTETWHHGPLPARLSAIEVVPSQVSVQVVKRSEDGTGWVLRLWETGGVACEARVHIPALGQTWAGMMGADEVKTLLFPDDRARPITEVDIPELGQVPTKGGSTPP
jgi:alpha-mannosidase